MTEIFFPFSSKTSLLGYFEAQRFVFCLYFLVFKVRDFLFVFHGSGTFKGILSMQIVSQLQQESYNKLASWSETPLLQPLKDLKGKYINKVFIEKSKLGQRIKDL